jgi:hypothetical protein
VSGLTDFEAFIGRVESLGKLNANVAKAALEPVTEIARETAAAGTTPKGEKWAPHRADSEQPLPGADAAIQSSASGTKIELGIGAPWVFHQHGAGGHSQTKEALRARKRAATTRAKSGTESKFHAPRRQIIPAPGDALPPKMAEAIKEAASDVFGKAVR